MNALTLTEAATLTMSSREIAELTGKRHDNVIRDIRKMLAELYPTSGGSSERRTPPTLGNTTVATELNTSSWPKEPSTPSWHSVSPSQPHSFEYIYTDPQNGQSYPEFRLPKRETLVLIAGYSIELRKRIIDRWLELEARQAATPATPAIPQTLPEALRLAAEAIEERDRLALENQAKAEALAIAAPKAQALDRIAADDKALTVTQAAKVLGVKREALTTWLSANGWMYRQNGSWVAYQQHIQNGRLLYKEARYTDENTGQEVYRPYCHITPKGLAKLAEAFSREVAHG